MALPGPLTLSSLLLPWHAGLPQAAPPAAEPGLDLQADLSEEVTHGADLALDMRDPQLPAADNPEAAFLFGDLGAKDYEARSVGVTG